MSLDAKPSIPSGATLPDVLQQDEDKSTPIVVNSVAEFIEKIVQFDKEEGTQIFYRGHADRDWELLPSIFRTPNGVEKEHLLFRDMVAHEPQSFLGCQSTLDHLVQMQHYGLPTRLLDVTANPLVALYFACEQVDNDVSAGVWAGSEKGLEVLVGIEEAADSIAKSEPKVVIEAFTTIREKARMLSEYEPRADSIDIAKALAMTIMDAPAAQKALGMAVAKSAAKSMVKPISMIAAVAGAVAGAGAVTAARDVAIILARIEEAYYKALKGRTESNGDPIEVSFAESLTQLVFEPSRATADEAIAELLVALAAEAAAEAGVEAGALAREKDGLVYFFSVPNGKVKHYDSDNVSVLAKLAKCLISELCSDLSSLEDFNQQLDIDLLLHQIRGEKPHFRPIIQASDLSSIFFVKAKNGNQRIANQMGAFMLFGLGVERGKDVDEEGEASHLTKGVHAEIPAEWIKRKFVVPKEKKTKILKELAHLGITESYIYPGIEQYAKELKKRYKL